jgi:hypothetical protein
MVRYHEVPVLVSDVGFECGMARSSLGDVVPTVLQHHYQVH